MRNGTSSSSRRILEHEHVATITVSQQTLYAPRPNPVALQPRPPPSNIHIPREHTVYIQYFWSKAQKETPEASKVKRKNGGINANHSKKNLPKLPRISNLSLMLDGKTVNQHSVLLSRNNTGIRQQQSPRTPDELAQERVPPDTARFSVFLLFDASRPTSLLFDAISWKQ